MPSDLSDDYEIPYPKSVITGWMAERDALRVRLGTAEELLRSIRKSLLDFPRGTGGSLDRYVRRHADRISAFLSDGAP